MTHRSRRRCYDGKALADTLVMLGQSPHRLEATACAKIGATASAGIFFSESGRGRWVQAGQGEVLSRWRRSGVASGQVPWPGSGTDGLSQTAAAMPNDRGRRPGASDLLALLEGSTSRGACLGVGPWRCLRGELVWHSGRWWWSGGVALEQPETEPDTVGQGRLHESAFAGCGLTQGRSAPGAGGLGCRTERARAAALIKRHRQPGSVARLRWAARRRITTLDGRSVRSCRLAAAFLARVGPPAHRSGRQHRRQGGGWPSLPQRHRWCAHR